MPPDPAEVREWIDRARVDLEIADILLTREDRLLDGVGFHAQQAAEKALKGFAISRGTAFERLHDLNYLIELCVRHDTTFEDFRSGLETLTPFAVEHRYPGSSRPERSAMVGAVEVARRLLDHVSGRLGG